ncbi:cell division protein FtsQ [Chthonomonas calidirosea]|uniref:Cell division protein FtsQ n=1 Tax=Chthonomonas calidirosea (strain DSM 23976 / ICMP 18418 / T49) TaxID=1303518 RepID=S0EY98_CHTCT|nr:FtsQ-type POTRA domain-containing protein [Chthonomonas calidirosea]CCW34797.1 cell division protein FtsQ [Chthonomonas calidirosea T49]CEK12747.1 cell division protein FtsQ [Chthonomonas calidirosea]CEK13767.1 cell division protein FtsQ [Chthonomonas calidirosea]
MIADLPPKSYRSTAKKRRLVVGTLSLLLCIEVACALFTSPYLRVSDVVVKGLADLSPQEIDLTQQTAAKLLRHNWFIAPTHSVRQALHHLPWVRSVHIVRHFPHTLRLVIGLRQPFCRLVVGSTTYEMDDEGVPIRLARSSLPPLPTIHLPQEAIVCGRPLEDIEIGALLTILKQSRIENHPAIADVEVDSERNICLNMSDGMRVLFGQAEEIEQKIALLNRIYELQPNVAQLLSVVNLTCPSHPAAIPRLAYLKATSQPEASSPSHSIPSPPRNERSKIQG